jgi:hypothetical protein
VHEPDPAHGAILQDLQRRAVDTYGEDRAAESTVQTALRAAATALWRVTGEPLEPTAPEP